MSAPHEDERERERPAPLSEEEASLAREGERLETSQPDPAEPAGENDPRAEAEREAATDRPKAADSVEEQER